MIPRGLDMIYACVCLAIVLPAILAVQPTVSHKSSQLKHPEKISPANKNASPKESSSTPTKKEVDNVCIEAAYCNLLKGDIAGHSEIYGRDPQPFYKEATRFANFSESHIPTEVCKTEHKKCLRDVATMATFGLQLGKPMTDCPIESLPFMVFLCRTIKAWPKSVVSLLPENLKNCTEMETCWCFEAFESYHQNIGNTNKSMVHWNERKAEARSLARGGGHKTLSSSPVRVQQRAKAGTRIVSEVHESSLSAPGVWSELVECPPKTFALQLRVYTLDNKYLKGVPIVCKRPGNTTIRRSSELITSTKPSGRGFATRLCYDDDAPFDAPILGLELTTSTLFKYGRIPHKVRILCPDNKWHGNGPEVPQSSAPEALEGQRCSNGLAICSIQEKLDIFENVTFITNVRIGCCPLESKEEIEFATGKAELNVLTYTVGDEKPTLNMIHLEEYSKWKTSYCPPGYYFDGFQFLRGDAFIGQNPLFKEKGRFTSANFMCTSPNKKVHHPLYMLDSYATYVNFSRPSTEKTLVGGEIGACREGVYNSVKVTYATVSPRQGQYEIGFKCSTTNEYEFYGTKAPKYQSYETYDCPTGFAICGYRTTLVDCNGHLSQIGTYLSLLCCPYKSSQEDCKLRQRLDITGICDGSESVSVTTCKLTVTTGILETNTSGHTNASTEHTSQRPEDILAQSIGAKNDEAWELMYRKAEAENNNKSGVPFGLDFGFSWQTVSSKSYMKSVSTSTSVTVEPGVKVYYVQPVATCGDLTLRHDFARTVSTPSTTTCKPEDYWREIYTFNNTGMGDQNATVRFRDIGITWIGQPVNGLYKQLNMTFHSITKGLKETFLRNDKLRPSNVTKIHWSNEVTNPSVWNELDTSTVLERNYSIPAGRIVKFFQLIGKCQIYWSISTDKLKMELV